MEEDGERVHKKTSEEVDGYNVDDGKVTWDPHNLSSPQETSKGNILHLTIILDQQNHYMERISKNKCFYEDLPYKEKFPFPKEERKSVLHNYKSPKAFINQGTHDLSHLWHSRAVKSFLT